MRWSKHRLKTKRVRLNPSKASFEFGVAYTVSGENPYSRVDSCQLQRYSTLLLPCSYCFAFPSCGNQPLLLNTTYQDRITTHETYTADPKAHSPCFALGLT